MLTLEKVKNYLAEKYDIKMTGDDPVIFQNLHKAALLAD